MKAAVLFCLLMIESVNSHGYSVLTDVPQWSIHSWFRV
jgi:hypothetical protein